MSRDSIERMMDTFRADASREVDREDFIAALADTLGFRLLNKAASHRPANRLPSKTYTTNDSFWMDALRGTHRESQWIELQRFHLTEWLPCSPGRYHTPEAAEARERAKQFISWTHGEYLPLGKESMMLGGVGSVRLKGRTIDGKSYHFLGASSTGVSHQGLPLIVPDSEYSDVVDDLIESGGCVANIHGHLRVMPAGLSLISYDKELPKYFIVADAIQRLGNSSPHHLLATAAVMYSGSYYDHYEGHGDALTLEGFTTKFRKRWTFCSFNPAKGRSAIASAVTWLKDYAGRHSGGTHDPIFSDFDEHYQHFEAPVEFPIGRIVDGRVDVERLSAYGQHYGFQIIAKELHVRNMFSNISNATIINESQVENSFNKVAAEKGDEVAQALLKVAEVIEKSKNPEAGALFNTFNGELQKKDANKTVLKTLWNGIIGLLPSLATMTDIVSKITSLFS